MNCPYRRLAGERVLKSPAGRVWPARTGRPRDNRLSSYARSGKSFRPAWGAPDRHREELSMRKNEGDHPDEGRGISMSRCHRRWQWRGERIGALALALVAGCGNSTSGGSNSGGSGGGSAVPATGGATSVPNGTGGATSVPNGTGGASMGGASSVPNTTGGTTSIPSGTGGTVLVAGARPQPPAELVAQSRCPAQADPRAARRLPADQRPVWRPIR